jgi:DNA ligase D-like protein (predicted 3'-phosphoesterase)
VQTPDIQGIAVPAPLDDYRKKRDPARTPEPFALPRADEGRLFVVQKHAARRLHYDVRLEMDGVLKSWAVPKGPSLRAEEKRLAVHVEDHPVEYAEFEGNIPDGNYGAGAVIVWDLGWYRLVKDGAARDQLKSGRLEIELFGVKLRGRWTLARMGGKDKEWLLLKKADGFAAEVEATERFPESVLSGLTLEEVRQGGARLAAVREALDGSGAPAGAVDAAHQPVMLASQGERAFSGPGWLFEIKYDGVRILAARDGESIALWGRAGQDFTGRYPEVVTALRALPATRFVLDGEVIALDEGGRPSFQRLQNRMHLTAPTDVERARPLQNVFEQVLRDLQVPREVLQFINYPTQFDSSATQELLDKGGIRVPPLEDYAWRLWDYWERQLDPDLSIDRSLRGAVNGKVVVVTGGSSGIGEATAIRIADAGGKVLVVARDEQKLKEVRSTIQSRGGFCRTYSCDITDLAANDELAKNIVKEFGAVDVLINNAGRSIRRSINLSYDRFHDYERTIQLNYFACVRLTMNLLPSMSARRSGHIINVSSIGVLTNAPRFSAYVSSKAALESFARCAAAEFHDEGVHFTIVNMPLVRTPMIAPTRIYDAMPTIITPDEAADMIADAVIRKPQRIATRLGVFSEIMYLMAPKMSEVVMNSAFRMFPDSAASQGRQEGGTERPPTREALLFASLMRGIHW